MAARNLSTHCRKNRTKISKSRAKKELSNGIKIGNSVFYTGCPIFSYTVTYIHNNIIKFLLTIKARRPICQNIYGQRKSMSLYLRATYISLAK